MENVKEVSKWVRLEKVELNLLEKAIFNSILGIAWGRKSFEELKDLGTVKVHKGNKKYRNCGINVEVDISETKKASFLFGSSYGKYEYRGVGFIEKVTIPREEII